MSATKPRVFYWATKLATRVIIGSMLADILWRAHNPKREFGRNQLSNLRLPSDSYLISNVDIIATGCPRRVYVQPHHETGNQ